MSLCIPAPDDGSDPPIERMFISVLTVCYVLKDANFTLKHCQNILKIVWIDLLMALGMICFCECHDKGKYDSSNEPKD